MTKNRYLVRLAVYLLFCRGKEILVMRRAGSGYYDGWYSFPSGHLEAREVPTEALIREIAEETGVSVDPTDVSLVHTMFRLNRLPDTDYVDLFFTTTKWSGEPSIGEPDKCDDMQWASIDALPEKTIPYIRQLIQDVEDGVRFSEVRMEALPVS